jgi:hypothetical protein
MATLEVSGQQVFTTLRPHGPSSSGRSLGQKNAAAGYRYSTRWLSVLLSREETSRMKKSITLTQACDGLVRYASQAPPV